MYFSHVCVFFTCNKHSRFVTTSFENRTISKINNQVHFCFHFHFHAESFSTFFNGNIIEGWLLLRWFCNHFWKVFVRKSFKENKRYHLYFSSLPTVSQYFGNFSCRNSTIDNRQSSWLIFMSTYSQIFSCRPILKDFEWC